MIIGVSPDPPRAQSKFQQRFGLPFVLLCDTEHALAEAYGVWVEKNMYGKKSMGIERSTFVIGPGGTVQQALRKVKAEGHAGAVLASLR